MTQPIRNAVSCILCTCLMLSSTTTLWAQTTTGQVPAQPSVTLDSNLTKAFDINAPLINHTISALPSLAGELYTIEAEITDDKAVRSAQLFYKTSTSRTYMPQELTPNTHGTWSVKINTSADDSYVWYYLVAEDADGNRVQKGSQRTPLMVQLQQPKFFPAEAPTSQNTTRWLLVGLGVLAAGAAIAAASKKDNEPSATCCRVTIDFPNVGE